MSTPMGFTFSEIPDYYENASCVKPFDYDKDGDIDLFVGNESVSNNFGKEPRSCLLRNDNGKFTPVQKSTFEGLGMVTDVVWDDFNKDGYTDLVVVGEWMAPTFLANKQGSFEKQEVVAGNLGGLWQTVAPFDIDHDGDTDYVLGNWGLNSKFRASAEAPLKMYYADFDQNGQSETIIA